MSQDTPTPRVLRTAPVIAKRIGEILGEPGFPPERVYQWRDAGKIRTFNIGPNVCARDDTLIAAINRVFKSASDCSGPGLCGVSDDSLVNR